MWLATRHGFFSLVCARQGDGAHHQPVDPELMMLRARSRDHIERLRQAFPALVGTAEVMESATADYPVRLLLPKADAMQLAAALVGEMAWDNFKSEAGRVHGHGSAYVGCLHRVWSVMRDLDQRFSSPPPSRRGGGESSFAPDA